MSEKLSALIDNELDDLERARVLKQLGRRSDLAERWSRYHVIGLAMRREEISRDRGLPERVARALEAGPGAAATEDAPRRGAPWLNRPARLALAASAAAVLLVGGLAVQLSRDAGTGRSVEPGAPALQQAALGNDATRWENVDPRVEDALNALLVEHGEFTSASGMNGLTAYTKFVAYDSR